MLNRVPPVINIQFPTKSPKEDPTVDTPNLQRPPHQPPKHRNGRHPYRKDKPEPPTPESFSHKESDKRSTTSPHVHSLHNWRTASIFNPWACLEYDSIKICSPDHSYKSSSAKDEPKVSAVRC